MFTKYVRTKLYNVDMWQFLLDIWYDGKRFVFVGPQNNNKNKNKNKTIHQVYVGETDFSVLDWMVWLFLFSYKQDYCINTLVF